MKLKDLLKNIDVISSNADMDMEISGISYDSRKVESGHLFVAVKGLTVDGHRFIPKAMELGAAAVLCQDIPADGSHETYIKAQKPKVVGNIAPHAAWPCADNAQIGVTHYHAAGYFSAYIHVHAADNNGGVI